MELFYENRNGVISLPPSLAILLLGVILLDSINMLPGKGMPRDGAAIQNLLQDTDWTQLALPQEILDGNQPDPTKLFDCLQSQKFSPAFWKGLTPLQAMHMDYKSFLLPSNKKLGIATILQDMETFWNKEQVAAAMTQIIREDSLQVLGLMFTFMAQDDKDDDNKKPRRQLILSSMSKDTLTNLLQYLTDDVDKLAVDLQLLGHEKILVEMVDGDYSIYLVKMNQENSTASRKQVAPVLTSFWKNSNDRTLQEL